MTSDSVQFDKWAGDCDESIGPGSGSHREAKMWSFGFARLARKPCYSSCGGWPIRSEAVSELCHNKLVEYAVHKYDTERRLNIRHSWPAKTNPLLCDKNRAFGGEPPTCRPPVVRPLPPAILPTAVQTPPAQTPDQTWLSLNSSPSSPRMFFRGVLR